jgi:hypothetical protein
MASTGDGDKAIFFVMMGGCLLALAIGPFYWASYTYRQYSSSVAFLAELRANTDENLTPAGLEERRFRIVVESGTADNRRLEMLGSAAGGIVLAGIALLLFRKAWKERSRRVDYVDIDQRTIPRPKGTITVRSTRFQLIMLGVLTIFFGFLSMMGFLQTLKSAYMSSMQIVVIRAILLFLILLPAVIFMLIVRAQRNSVRTIDQAGVTRGDGRMFGWSEFLGVVNRIGRERYGGTFIWRKELMFRGGQSAWIIPVRIKNGAEVFAFVDSLPAAIVRD